MYTTRRQFALLAALTLTTAAAASSVALAETPADNAAAAPVVIEAGANATYVNVMKGAMPKLPAFAALAPKRGFVRGYVKDVHGKPLAGARLGVRSTVAGGFYSGAQGKTDAKGYYEIEVPWGAAHFYNAGYTVDYGEGRAALGLHPADGEADSFATANGSVENWVLLPYGIANRDDAQDKPYYINNYYGGGIHISYNLHDGSIFASPGDLPPNTRIELTLTPDGPLLDGSRGRTFVVRKPVSEDGINTLNVNNIPVGAYRIAARLLPSGGAAGTPLVLKEIGPNGGSAFGIEPKQATGTATLLLRPTSANAERAGAAHGNWDTIALKLERPAE